MKRTLTLLCLLVLSLGSACARADLAAYLKKPEPAYRWEKRGEEKIGSVTVTDLYLVSQTWQGFDWDHRLLLFRPDEVKHPNFCGLYNTGGDGTGQRERQIFAAAAQKAKAPFAVLYGIPKQPLYGGKTEDALVVYTWQKYLETGDESWPLHFPMAKACLKAMDAIQAYTKSAGLPVPSDFMVTGASKRGWTAWLVGASRDPRVKSIAPIVIDTLHVAKQIPHQLESYGKPSEQIEDYSGSGMLEMLNTPKGKRLLELEDPYSYRDILTLPKLLINGTNDRYWAQDALNIYWDDLKGPKWVLYVPNNGHGINDFVRLTNVLTAFSVATATKTPWPKMKWEYSDTAKGIALNVGSDIRPTSAVLWRASSKSRDFRDSRWTSEPMQPNRSRGFIGELDAPAEGYTATFAEVTYEVAGMPFTLSTQIKIVGKK